MLGAEPAACPFRFRCPSRFERCDRENPTRIPVGPGHDAACFWDPEAGAPRDV
jgi:ABC-type dipeptide/oligopeptide/nickel transport system ATPase component